jgi:hypothetical protein
MTVRVRGKSDMSAVPDPGLDGALSEIWSGINHSAYHLSYVGVYLQSAALQAPPSVLRNQEQGIRDQLQADVVISGAHIAKLMIFGLLEVGRVLRSMTKAWVHSAGRLDEVL